MNINMRTVVVDKRDNKPVFTGFITSIVDDQDMKVATVQGFHMISEFAIDTKESTIAVPLACCVPVN